MVVTSIRYESGLDTWLLHGSQRHDNHRQRFPLGTDVPFATMTASETGMMGQAIGATSARAPADSPIAGEMASPAGMTRSNTCWPDDIGCHRRYWSL